MNSYPRTTGYGSSDNKPTITVPSEFFVQPQMAEMLEELDAYVAALTAPPPAPAPQLPPGYQLMSSIPVSVSPESRRRALIDSIVAWHNQLVTAVRDRNRALDEVTRAGTAAGAAEKLLGEVRATLAKERTALQERDQVITGLNATVRELREREALYQATVVELRKTAGQRAQAARRKVR